MKLYPSKAQCCDADLTRETAMQTKLVLDDRGRRVGTMRDKQIHHARFLGGVAPDDDLDLPGQPVAARFWHWSTTEELKCET